MIDSHKIDYSKLDTLNVSRETFLELDEFKEMILDENKKINLISQHTEELARDRHIIDCAQIIDLIDENHLSCTDLGSGSGLPGLVIAIIKKKQKSKMKFFLYEKSFKKSNFLKKVINKFELNAEVINQNIFDQKKLNSDLIVARAFKPLPVILDLVKKNFDDFKDIILFLGKSGKSSIEQSLKNWNLEFIEKKSVTEKDSIIIKINKVSKKKMKEKIISVINQKGGVGKTTTVINLAAGLTLNGKKILVIDLDPQGNATTGLGLSNVADTSKSIYGVLNGKEEIQSSIQKTNFQNLDIVTSNVDLSGLEVETADDENRAYLLKTKLTAYLNNSSPVSYTHLTLPTR